jgi:hypothetical protein
MTDNMTDAATDTPIILLTDGERIETTLEKFISLVGDEMIPAEIDALRVAVAENRIFAGGGTAASSLWTVVPAAIE